MGRKSSKPINKRLKNINYRTHTDSKMSPKTFVERQIRGKEKKARQRDEKAMKTEDPEEKERLLQEADGFREEARVLREHATTDKKRAKKKVVEANKSVDDILDEAIEQANRERAEAEKLLKEEEIKEDEKRGRRAGLKSKMADMQAKREEAKGEFHRIKGELEEAEKVEKDLFSKEYREKHPDATDSEIQKEFVRKQKLNNRKENIVGFFVQNMAEITGEESKEVYERFKEFVDEFMERPENKRKMDKMVSSETEDVIQSLEEEAKAQLTEANCKKQFVEQVAKMTGENEEDIEKEYDEDYKKFTAFAEEEGYTRRVTVDKYVDVSNKKLQAAHLRYMIVSNLMKDKGMNVNEANDEFDKMMDDMIQDPVPEEPMCLPCK